MEREPEGASGGAGSLFNSVQSTASPRLLARDASYNPSLPPSRNFAHGLDFNSPQRYNERTSEEWRTIAPPVGIY